MADRFNCIPAYCEGAWWLDEAARLERSKLCGTAGYPWEPCPRVITREEQIKQGTFGGCNFPSPQPNEVFGFSVERGCYRECAPGFHPYGYTGQTRCVRDFKDDFDAGDYFKDVGMGILQGAALVMPALYGVSAWAAAAHFANTTYQTLKAAEVINVGLDLGGIFGGVANTLGGLSSGNYLGALSGAFQTAGAAFAPAPTAMYGGPVYSPPPVVYQQQAPIQATPVMATFPAGAAAISRLAAVTAPILAKIAVKLGLRARPSLTRAMDLIRKSAKILTSPEAVAAALGITLAELAQLITASNARKRRRMNPANSKALRRAARRIKSFHRLCTHTDVLKGRGRRSASRSCGTCRKSPCRC